MRDLGRSQFILLVRHRGLGLSKRHVVAGVTILHATRLDEFVASAADHVRRKAVSMPWVLARGGTSGCDYWPIASLLGLEDLTAGVVMGIMGW